MTRGRRLAAVAAGAVVVVLGLTVPGWEADDDQPRALVYLSGFDDHLLEAHDTVLLYRQPGEEPLAEVPTDTLAWVYGEAGEWVEVRLAEGTPHRGWVADFFLRGELHLVDPGRPGCPVPAGGTPGRPDQQLDPSTKVRLVDFVAAGGAAATGGWARVRVLATGADWWVERRVLSERPGPHVRRLGGPVACEEITAEPVAPHVHRPGVP